MEVSIFPTNATIGVGQPQTFTSNVSGGLLPYYYQWCLNGAIVSGANSPTWTFTPSSSGSYSVYLNVTTFYSGAPFTVESNTASVTVARAYIYIKADGSIDPPTAPILTTDNITFSLTDNINADVGVGSYGIVIMRDNIIVDGNGFTVRGTQVYLSGGIYLSGRENVTVRNTQIKDFYYGIYLVSSSSNSIIGNNITHNFDPSGGDGIRLVSSINTSIIGNNIAYNIYHSGITLLSSSNYNGISGNNITNNLDGIQLWDSCNNNSISGNRIANNRNGIELGLSLNNGICGNNITANYGCGIGLVLSSDNRFLHNNFADNTQQVYIEGSGNNIWDGGYPSGGNYWSDYPQKYPNASQIDNSGLWNTPYTIDANNTDRYPLMFPSSAFLTVMSKYSGYFVQNLPLDNVFGVYTGHEGGRPIKVYGILSDIEGSQNVSFSNVTDPSGAYLSAPVDMGSLSPNATLQVFAVYSDGTILNKSYPIKVIQTPSWLISILNTVHLITVEPQIGGQWNNSYKIHVEKEINLSCRFNITIPLSKVPKFAGGGNYTLLPSVEFEFSFYSNGTCEISSSGIGESVPMEFGVGKVTAHISVTVTGEIALENDTISWISASFSLAVGASTSVNVPIVGYTFSVPYLGDITLGFSATITYDADFGVTMVLAPTQNNSEEFISGIGIMIQSITGEVSFSAGIAINAGVVVASVTGGGDIEVDVYLQATQPYIYEYTVTGTVSITYHAFFIWSGTIWSKTGTLYHWPEGAGILTHWSEGGVESTNFTVTARYYNTSDYEEFTWTNGSLAGTAIHDIYPLTRISAASSGDDAYILYTDDNVSVPVQSGLCWTGLEFNSSQGTLRSFSLPAISDEIFFSPVVISLPNGSLLAMWDSIPLSEVSNATGPFDINRVIPQYSCFDTNTQSWGPIKNLVESGVTTSYLLSSDSAEFYALALQGDSLFSNNQSLVEYDLKNGSELLSINVNNASNIVSFDCVSHLAVLQMLDGSCELLNLSSSQLINLPSVEGCQVKIVQLVTNSTDSVGVLYSSNATSDILSIYNVSSSTISFSMNVSQSTNSLTLTKIGSGYQLVAADSSGITSYVIADQGAEQTAFYPMENITSMGSTNTEKGILVYTTENYGNSSYPLLNLTLTFIIHDVAVKSVVAGPNTVCQGYGCAIEASLANIGDFPETFNVIVYANNTDNGTVTAIHTFVNVSLNGNDSTILTFMWDTTGFVTGNYTVSAYVTSVPGELDLADNSSVSSVIQVIAGMSGGGGGRMPCMD